MSKATIRRLFDVELESSVLLAEICLEYSLLEHPHLGAEDHLLEKLESARLEPLGQPERAPVDLFRPSDESGESEKVDSDQEDQELEIPTGEDEGKEIKGDESAESEKIKRIKRGDEGVLISAKELLGADLPDIDFAVPGLFPVGGVSLLAGPPKSGKSLLSLNLALSVSRGGKALGKIPVEQGNVLLMSLEDGARRTSERVNKMTSPFEKEVISPTLDRLKIAFDWEKFQSQDGGEEGGKDFLRSVLGAFQKFGDDYRLIVVDTLQRLRRQAEVGSSIYVEDYKAMQDFQDIARELDAGVILNHHTNKLQDAEDPYLRVSGSTGLTAQADTVAVLEGDRIESEAQLQVSGRDISGHKLGLKLDTDTLNWQLIGSGHALGMGDVRQQIYDVLDNAESTMSPSDVSDELENIEYERIKVELGRMVDAKQIKKPARGEYATSLTVQPGLFED